MAESTQITFTHQEVVEALLRKQGISTGIWGLYIKFGIGATNMGVSPSDLNPTAIVPVLQIGLQQFDEVNNLSIDASKLGTKTKPKSVKK